MDPISWQKFVFLSFQTLLILLSFLWLASAAVATSASCHPNQRSALLELKKGFIKSNLTSWRHGTDCCSGWEGVYCNESSGHVISLDLSSYNIEGNLSVAIFNLTSLQHLNLAYNCFSYDIPDGFEKLTKLTQLDLSNSCFSGQIPIGISKLKHLISLDLSGYWGNLRLRKPSLRTLISKLSKLRELRLDYVDISENGTEWCGALSESVPLLQVLSMSNCNLSGPFDISLSRLHSLTIIDLSLNNFHSSVPDYFSDFPLKSLLLFNSNLTGLISSKIFQIPSLSILDISNNEEVIVESLLNFPLGSSVNRLDLSGTNLHGRILDSIVNLQNLSSLKLGSSNLSGQIPSSIGKLVKLEHLVLFSNSLSGSIPQTLFSLPNLKTLELSNNNLSGQLRLEDVSSILFCPLTYLSLDNNQLTGSIPRLIYKLSNLKILFLSNNQFSGPIPNSIFMLHSLQLLDLTSNKFNGTIKLSLLQNLPNLTDLYLSDNHLSIEDVSDEQLSLPFPKVSSFRLASCNLSQIPRLLRYHDGLTDVDLSKNHMHGFIPSWIWEKFSSIYSDGGSLDLSANGLTGKISSSICDASLIFLDLSSNNFNSSIPPCLLGAPSLVFLNLATNKFHGIVPNNVQKPCQLEVLDLGNNDLHGELPRSLSKCTSLMILNIENNRIADTFPFWLGEIPNLQVLILRSNQLYGTLEAPSNFASNISLFQKLRILDLASNNINGSLPTLLFENLRSMANLSYEMTLNDFTNYTEAIFSTYNYGISITDKGIQMKLEFLLTYLMVEIDLSENRFSGDIPEMIGTLSELRALNLSHNSFDRSIPSSLKNLDYIESLDLSCNNLSGEIPQELTSLNSLTTINLSFNHFVGRIPQSPHFLTFGNLSFEGNPRLCGVPLSKQCEVVNLRNTSSTSPSKSFSKKMSAIILLCLFVGLGFGTGFAIVIIYPVIKRARNWRTTG